MVSECVNGFIDILVGILVFGGSWSGRDVIIYPSKFDSPTFSRLITPRKVLAFQLHRSSSNFYVRTF